MEKYELKEPIELGSNTITYFEIPEKLQARHVRNVPLNGDLNNMGTMIDIIEGICLQPKAVVDRLGVGDLLVISEKVGQLLEKQIFREIGKG